MKNRQDELSQNIGFYLLTETLRRGIERLAVKKQYKDEEDDFIMERKGVY